MVSATRSANPLPALLASLLLGLLAWLSAAPALAASLNASVDRAQLARDETLTLTLRYDSRDASGQPDLSALEPFFEVLGQTQSRQLRILNGRTEAFTEWQITLAPKLEGRILLPAFELGGARSQPLEVRVSAPQVSPNQRGGDTFIERIVEPQNGYVGQQLRVRVRLNTAVGLADMQLTPLQVAGAKLLALEDRQYQRNLNGRAYLVYEKNYALFPEQAGTLTLPVQQLSAFKGASRSLFDSNRGQRLRLRQPAQTIEVRAAPAADDWLPADALRLEQSLLGNGPFKVGEPLTLQLKLVAEGADPARLPLLGPPDLPGVKVYPEPAEDEQQQTADGLVTVRSQRFALVPTQPGSLRLPALQQRWWHNARGAFETASSLALELEVAPAAGAASPQPPPNQALSRAVAAPPATLAAPAPDGANPPPAPPAERWWLWSQLLWALLATLLAWGWWRASRRTLAAASVAEPAAEPASQAAPARDAALQQLRAACSARDPAATRQALLSYAQARRLTRPPVTLAALKALAGEELRAQLERLDQALYAPAAAPPPDFDALLRQLGSLQPAATGKAPQQGLKPLYP